MSVNVGTAIGYLDLDASKFKVGLKDAQSTLSEFTNKANDAGTRFQALGSSLKTVGSVITKTVSLPLLALGAGALKVAGDFEAGMSEVSAITGATGKDIQALEKQAKTLGATTKFSARDAAEGMKYFGMAGYDTNQIMSALPSTLNLAAAGNVDLGIACDIVSDAMTGLGMSANETTKFTDIMAATITNSNTSVELMGETLKYVGPVAGTLGIGMGDLSVAIGLMGNAGIKGSQAGTALRAGLTNLVKPTKEMKIAMEKYGVELVKNADGSVNMMGTMENLRSTLGGLDQATQAQALATIFGKEAMSAWASVVNASEGDFNKLSEAIANSDGKASDMAKTMQDNLKGSIDNMKSAFEGLLITIGERLIPVFRSLVDGITNVFTWFNNLNPVIQNVIIGVGGFLAVLGPAILIVGNLILVFKDAITGIGLLKTALTTLSTVMKTNLIGTIISLNTTLHSTIIPALTSFASMISGAVMSAISAVSAFLTGTLIPALTATAFSIGAVTVPVWVVIAAFAALVAAGVLVYKNWDTIKSKCTEIWENSIKPTIEVVTNTIKAFLTAAWTGIKAFLSTCWNLLKQLATSIWNGIKSVIETVCNGIKNIITTVWNSIKSTTTTVWNGIKSLITTVVNSIKSVIQNVFNAVKSVVTTIWNSIKTVIQTAWNGIKSVVSTGANLVKSTISSVFSTLTNIMTAPFKAAQSVISGILGGITSAINKVTSSIKKVTSMFRMVEDPRQEEQEYLAACNDNDYTKARFDYARAKQTTVSDVIATNYSMIEGLKDFARGIKTDSSQAKVNTDNNVNISLNIDKFINETSQSIDDLMDEIAFKLRRKALF